MVGHLLFLKPECSIHLTAAQSDKKPAAGIAAGESSSGRIRVEQTLLLPSTLLVAIRFQALAALVLVHFQTTFLFQITHGELERTAKMFGAPLRVKPEFRPVNRRRRSIELQ